MFESIARAFGLGLILTIAVGCGAMDPNDEPTEPLADGVVRRIEGKLAVVIGDDFVTAPRTEAYVQTADDRFYQIRFTDEVDDHALLDRVNQPIVLENVPVEDGA